MKVVYDEETDTLTVTLRDSSMDLPVAPTKTYLFRVFVDVNHSPPRVITDRTSKTYLREEP